MNLSDKNDQCPIKSMDDNVFVKKLMNYLKLMFFKYNLLVFYIIIFLSSYQQFLEVLIIIVKREIKFIKECIALKFRSSTKRF